MGPLRSVPLPACLVLWALLAAGCVASTQAPPPEDKGATTVAWTPLACDPGGVTRRGDNAELVAGLRQSPEAIAQDVAGVAADRLAKETTREPERPSWTTERGGEVTVSLWTDDGVGQVGQVMYEGPGTVERSDMEALLEDWGVAKESLVYGSPMFGGDGSSGPASQRVAGYDVGWTEGGATWHASDGTTSISILRFWDFAALDATIGAESAATVGGQAARCALDGEGKTEAAGYPMLEAHMLWMGVIGNSTAYVVDVRFESADPEDLHCGLAKWVFVDAVTGAVLAIGEAFCA